AEEAPYWSTPPPCCTLPDTEYDASTSSMKPRACRAREMVRGKPVNDGCKNAQAIAVEPSALPRLAIVPSGKLVSIAKYAPSLTLSLQISVCVNMTQSAPCMPEGVQFIECHPHAEAPS